MQAQLAKLSAQGLPGNAEKASGPVMISSRELENTG